jgi:hypothetical protein
MAILKFRVYFQEDESIYRDIAIKHTHNFLHLHQALLQAYEFDNKHQATFYKSNDSWQRGKEITVSKYDKTYKVEPLIMADTQIGSQINDPNQKFLYEYDFTKPWNFAIELISIDKKEDNGDYPSCVRKEGVAPQQYGTKGLIDKRLAEMEEKYDLKPTALSEDFSEEGEEGNDDAEHDEAEEAGGEEFNNSEDY